MRQWPVIGVLCLLGGCGSPGVRAQFREEHPWYVVPPVELHDFLFDEDYVISKVWEVSASNLDEALSFLQRESCVHLAEFDQGDVLFGVPLYCLPPRDQLYLVRALYLNAQTGGFLVTFYQGHLNVRHVCLGHEFPPVSESALIVALPKAPTTVFVNCSMDE